MRVGKILFAVGFISLVAVSGCATRMTDAENEAALTGGIVGTGVGAGTGAIIGSSIANGDVAASAGLGAGVGLVGGVVGFLAYHEGKLNNRINNNDAQIKDNREYIQATQEDLDAYREQLLTDTMAVDPDLDKAEYRYEGPSLGNLAR